MNKPYLVYLAGGNKVEIDSDEVEKVMKAVSSGSAVVLRKAVIANPNTISCIVVDYGRLQDNKEDVPKLRDEFSDKKLLK